MKTSTNRVMHGGTLAIAIAAVVLSAASGAGAEDKPTPSKAAAPARPEGPPVFIVDGELNVRMGRLASVGVDAAGTAVLDSAGRRSRLGSSDLAVVLVDPKADPELGIGAYVPGGRSIMGDGETSRHADNSDELGELVTTEGERFPGKPAPAGSTGGKDVLVWRHPELGDVSVALDRVAAIRMPGAGMLSPVLAAPRDDELILRNGDKLTGLLSSVGATIKFEGKDGVVDLPIDRVAGVNFANPRRPMSGAVVWLDEGTVAGASKLKNHGSGENAGVSAWACRGILFRAEKLVALSTLTPTAQSPTGGRLSADPVRTVVNADDMDVPGIAALGALDVELPGPMKVEYTLPEGARRLACTAALDESAGAWGDCELSISCGSGPVFKKHLHAGEPAALVNMALSGKTLTITLDPGKYGPIRDRVRLMRALVLVDK